MALRREAGAAATMRTYWAWETTATLRLLGGARGDGAPTGEERGGEYCVATRTACFVHKYNNTLLGTRDVHGNGIPNGTGNPMGIPWEWE